MVPKGSYVGDNIRLLYGTLIYTEEHNIPGLLLAIDFEKAVDIVAWSFMQKCLEFFNVGANVKMDMDILLKYQFFCFSKWSLYTVVRCTKRDQAG